MKRYLIFFLFFYSLAVQADVDISNHFTLDSDTVWSPSNGVYILHGAVNISEGATLTIESGTIIKFKNGGAGIMNVYGSLIVQGSYLDNVYLTSILDDSIGGDTGADGLSEGSPADWRGIYFYPGSSGNLDYSTIRYAGYGGFGFGNFVAIENNGGVVNINNSTLERGKYRGIWQKVGTINIQNSTISDYDYGVIVDSGIVNISHNSIGNNKDYGIYYGGQDPVTIIGNNFYNNGKTAFIHAGSEFVHSDNVSEDVSDRGFRMEGVFRDGAILNSDDLPTIISGGAFVPQGQTLFISSGTIIKFGSDHNTGSISVYGDLIAEGTDNSRIYFTSIRDDSVGGDTNGDGENSFPDKKNWQGLYLENGSTASLKNVVIQYAGQNFNGEYLPGVAATIYNRGSNLVIDKTFIAHNFGAGIFQDSGTTTISKSELTDNQYGLLFRSGQVNISQSSLYELIDLAVSNESGVANGFSEVVTVDARGNWWGSDTGPLDVSTSTPTGTGSRVGINVLYDPWLTRDPALPPLRNPVIIVPGIIGSYLNDQNNSEVWPNLNLMAIPGKDIYLNILALADNGESISNILPTTIIKSISGFDLFNGLFVQLENNSFVVNQDLFDFSYDWRLDISKSSSALKQKIDQIKIQTGALKIDLVAHSMGGLLVKKYLKDYGGNSIDKFIDIATPQNGAPKSFKVLSYGDNFGFETFGLDILNLDRSKSISQNMTSVYQLLPSQKYFDDTDQSYKYYVFDGVNNTNRLNFEQTKDYLKNAGRNSALVDRADAFHQEIDNLNPADYGVKTYNIVGCGTPTIGQIYVLSKEGDHYNYNIRMINGDGTVPLKSAKAIPAFKTYFVKNAQHAVMPSTSGVKEIVASVLLGEENPDITSYSNIVMNDAECPIADGKIVSFHSPIDLNVYDSFGNHAGPDLNGDIKNNIPEVVYEIIEDNKFAFLPDGQEYNIIGNSTGSGTFDTRIETMIGGEVTNTTIFNDVLITPESQSKFSVGATIPTQIFVDKNGDGTFESTVEASKVSDGFLESTGKDNLLSIPEEIKISQPVSSGSRRNTPSSAPAIPQPPLNASTTPTQAKLVNLKQNETKTIMSVPQTNSQNTAVAYKSFGQSLKNVFKSLWSWIKSKI